MSRTAAVTGGVFAALVLAGGGFAVGAAVQGAEGAQEAERARTEACRTWETGLEQSAVRSSAHAVQEAAAAALDVPQARQEREFLGAVSGPEQAFAKLRTGALLAREAALVPGLADRDYRALADLGRGLELMRTAAVDGDHPEDEGIELLTIDRTATPLVEAGFRWLDRTCFSD